MKKAGNRKTNSIGHGKASPDLRLRQSVVVKVAVTSHNLLSTLWWRRRRHYCAITFVFDFVSSDLFIKLLRATYISFKLRLTKISYCRPLMNEVYILLSSCIYTYCTVSYPKITYFKLLLNSLATTSKVEDDFSNHSNQNDETTKT